MPKRPEPIPPLPLSGSKSGGRYVSPPGGAPGRVLPPGTPTRFSDTQVLLEELLAITSNIDSLPLSLADKMELLESALFKGPHISLLTKFKEYRREKHHGLDPSKMIPTRGEVEVGRGGPKKMGFDTLDGYPITSDPPGFFPDWSKTQPDSASAPMSTAGAKPGKTEEERLTQELERLGKALENQDGRAEAAREKFRNESGGEDAKWRAWAEWNAEYDKVVRILKWKMQAQSKLDAIRRDALRKKNPLDNLHPSKNKGGAKTGPLDYDPDHVSLYGIRRWILLWLLSPIAFHAAMEHIEQTARQVARTDPSPLDEHFGERNGATADISPKLWDSPTHSPKAKGSPVIRQKYITDPPKE